MRAYLLSVTAAAMILALLRTLAGEGTMGTLTRLLGGLFLAVTVLSPLVRLEIPDLSEWMDSFTDEGMEAAAAGEAMAEEYAAAIISAELEAYILDKAASLGAEVTAEVSLDADGMPRSVTVRGEISPAAREELSRYISQTLGLGEEAQRWNG